MYKFTLTVLVALFAFSANAREYGSYDPKRLITISETPEGKKYGFDGAYLDQILSDLSVHAKNYPPQFDTPQDKQRAAQDVKIVSGMLDFMINVPNPNPELLVRAGYLNSMGHNLDVPGAAEKADSIFLRLLAVAPLHPRGNYMYGTFLAGIGKPKESLPYLEKALSLGVFDAAYTIGMTYLALGNKDQALKNLQSYKRSNPSDGSVDTIIDAIRNGKVELKRSPG